MHCLQLIDLQYSEHYNKFYSRLVLNSSKCINTSNANVTKCIGSVPIFQNISHIRRRTYSQSIQKSISGINICKNPTRKQKIFSKYSPVTTPMSTNYQYAKMRLKFSDQCISSASISRINTKYYRNIISIFSYGNVPVYTQNAMIRYKIYCFLK